jgi:hypothetical protein
MLVGIHSVRRSEWHYSGGWANSAAALAAPRRTGAPSSPGENVHCAFVQRPFHVHTFLVGGVPDAGCAPDVAEPRRP